MGKSRFSDSAARLGRSADENAVLRDDEPIDSVEVVGQHAIKMGWLEKETEDSLLGGWNKRFAVLTGWDGQEAHLFYYKTEHEKEASGILFLSEMQLEEPKESNAFTLQGPQRRFRFRCESAELARSWRVAIQEAQTNGEHECEAGEACLAWRKDRHARTCQHCKRLFTVTIGKHHCRCCGRIFCSECTDCEKLMLAPYTKPVRCCLDCHKKQQHLISQKAEMQRRAQLFVANYLELLEMGSTFKDPDRPDVERGLMLEQAPNLSLQFRSLVIIEACEIDAMADAIGSKAVHGGKSIVGGLKSMTLRGFSAIRNVKNIEREQVAKAFEKEQARKNIEGAGKAIGGFAANTGKVILEVGSGSVMAAASLGLSLKDTVAGPQRWRVSLKDLVGVSDCASNPSMLIRLKQQAALAFALVYRDVRAGGQERELLFMCRTEEEKDAWRCALAELQLLSHDAGTNLLLVKKQQDAVNKRVTEEITRRQADRLSKSKEEYAAKTLRQRSVSPIEDGDGARARHGRSPPRNEPQPDPAGKVQKAPTLRERFLGSAASSS